MRTKDSQEDEGTEQRIFTVDIFSLQARLLPYLGLEFRDEYKKHIQNTHACKVEHQSLTGLPYPVFSLVVQFSEGVGSIFFHRWFFQHLWLIVCKILLSSFQHFRVHLHFHCSDNTFQILPLGTVHIIKFFINIPLKLKVEIQWLTLILKSHFFLNKSHLLFCHFIIQLKVLFFS